MLRRAHCPKELAWCCSTASNNDRRVSKVDAAFGADAGLEGGDRLVEPVDVGEQAGDEGRERFEHCPCPLQDSPVRARLHAVGRHQPAAHESGTSTTRNPSGSTSVTPCAFQYGFAELHRLSADALACLADCVQAAEVEDEQAIPRTIRVAGSPEQTFAPIQRIGGKTGWYYGNRFWRLRGLLDKLVGGVGLRRGRRDPVQLAVGDTLDFWRVEAFEQDRLLRLSAEMKTPGRIWLQFEVNGDPAGTTLRQTAIFDPHGLAGFAYWYALYPVHCLIFEGMLRRIERAALASERGSVPRLAGAGLTARPGYERSSAP